MPSSKQKTVLVGMSGGVDSSVCAALLQRQGFKVVGGFIKNWSDSKDLWTGECAWRDERRDAMRVAAKLGIPLLTFDFEAAYRERVVKDLFDGYAAGETPNPDVLCNEAIKFGLFFEEAQRLKFDYIATGHYARVRDWKYKFFKFIFGQGKARLLRGIDKEKDQSYFLYRVPQNALAKTIFPIGELTKKEVRALAKRFELPVAEKPDSQGICFIGKLDMAEFLRKKIPAKTGDIVDSTGEILGQHHGLDQFTIGQRQRLKIDKDGKAWYVARKEIAANRLVVVSSEDDPLLYQTKVEIIKTKWILDEAPTNLSIEVQVRYRQKPTRAKLTAENNRLFITFKEPVKAVAIGQSAVIYRGQECLGGGVMADLA